MYVAYLKESGIPSLNDKGNYVISAVIIQESYVDEVRTQLDKFKEDIFEIKVFAEKINLETNHILRGRGNFRDLDIEDRIDTIKEFAELMNSLNITLINIMIEKENVYSQGGNKFSYQWVLEWAWKLMVEKISKFVAEMGEDKFIMVKNSVNIHFDNFLEHLVSNTKSNFINSNFEGIDFVSKSNTSLTQLADLSAWTIRRYYRSMMLYGMFDELSKELFETLTPKLYGNENNRIMGNGIKIFPNLDKVDRSNLDDQKFRYQTVGRYLFGSNHLINESSFIYDEEE